MNKPVQHTPGPWKDDYRFNGYRDRSMTVKRGECLIATLPRGASQKIQEANARLIAAAPELLAALGAVRTLPGFEKNEPYGKLVLAAIAAAEGRDAK